jgi:tetratricopeptide (TPR) repeat protein
LLRRAQTAAERTLAPPHPLLAKIYNQMGVLQLQKHDHKSSGKLFTRALEMVRKLYGDHHPEVASSLGNLGLLAKHKGHYKEAETYYREALRSLKDLSANAEKTWLRRQYADLLRELHREEEADAMEKP